MLLTVKSTIPNLLLIGLLATLVEIDRRVKSQPMAEDDLAEHNIA